MKQIKLYPKVAFDLFYTQFKWSIWFFAFLIAAHIIGMIIVANNGAEVDQFFVFSGHSTAIFMLVCGILSAFAFLDYYVQQGITRKDFYFGTVIAAFALALAVTLIPLAVNGIEHLISTFTLLPINPDADRLFVLATGWLSATVIFFLNILTYYLIGLFIGLGYYRFGWLIGLGFVGMAIIAFSLNGFFLEDNGLSSIIPLIPYSPSDSSLIIAITGSLVLIAVLLVSMRLLTKRIPIKM